jgi:hypothetical protein
MRLRRLTGGEATGIVPLSCPQRTCRATRSPGIRMTWPSHRGRRRRMVVPIRHCCVRRRSSSVLMLSLRHTPRMLRRHRLWKNSSHCSCEGVIGQKHGGAIYGCFVASGHVPASPELCSPLHCCTRCCKSPADFLVEAAVRAKVAAQLAKVLLVWQLITAQGKLDQGRWAVRLQWAVAGAGHWAFAVGGGWRGAGGYSLTGYRRESRGFPT